METLMKMIEEIFANYEVRFIVEQAHFDQDKPVFRLKRRKAVRILWSTKHYDDYETNSIHKIINFKSLKEIETYLKFQFSEPEGFKTKTFDLNYNNTNVSDE